MPGNGLETRINNLEVAISNLSIVQNGSLNTYKVIQQGRYAAFNSDLYEVYDKTPMRFGTEMFHCVDHDNGMLYAGGGVRSKEWWQLNLSTGVWTQKADINVNTDLDGSTPFYYDGNIYLIAGNADGSDTSAIRKYNIAGNSWSVITATLQAANSFCCLFYDMLNSRLYILGGYGQNVDAHYLDLTDDTITNLPDIDTAAVFVTATSVMKLDNGIYLVINGNNNDVYAFNDIDDINLVRASVLDSPTSTSSGASRAYANDIGDFYIFYSGYSGSVTNGLVVNKATGKSFVLSRNDLTPVLESERQIMGNIIYNNKMTFLYTKDVLDYTDGYNTYASSIDLNYIFYPVAEVKTGQTVRVDGMPAILSGNPRNNVLGDYQLVSENMEVLADRDGTLYILLGRTEDDEDIHYTIR